MFNGKPKAKPASGCKGPSVSQVARAIDRQGSGYSDVMKGGPRTPPKAKPKATPTKEVKRTKSQSAAHTKS